MLDTKWLQYEFDIEVQKQKRYAPRSNQFFSIRVSDNFQIFDRQMAGSHFIMALKGWLVLGGLKACMV